MPCKERVEFVSNCVSCLFYPPEILRSTALIGVVDAGGLAVGTVYGLEVRAWGDVEGIKVSRQV